MIIHKLIDFIFTLSLERFKSLFLFLYDFFDLWVECYVLFFFDFCAKTQLAEFVHGLVHLVTVIGFFSFFGLFAVVFLRLV